MGSTDAPAYTDPGTVLQGNYNPGGVRGAYTWGPTGQKGLPGGSDALNYATNLMKNGLPDALKAEMIKRFQGSMAGNLRNANADLGQRFAQMGDVSIGAQQGAYAGLQDSANNATNDFYGNLLSQDFGAQQTGFGDYNTLIGTAAGIGNSESEYNMKKYEADQANSFSLGNLLGSIVGAGGTIGGDMASKGKCCFIFMEAYNGKLPWWVRECRDEFAPESSARREGYILMAKVLVPLMTHPGVNATPLKRGISIIVRWIVNAVMIKPLTKCGAWYISEVRGKKLEVRMEIGKLAKSWRLDKNHINRWWIYKPVVKFWFGIWEIIGKRKIKNGVPAFAGIGA